MSPLGSHTPQRHLTARLAALVCRAMSPLGSRPDGAHLAPPPAPRPPLGSHTPQRSFSVVSASSASANDTIQKRTTIFGSAQPDSS